MELKGLSEDVITQISELKNEEAWVKDYRLKSYKAFSSMEMPSFGPKVELDFSSIIYLNYFFVYILSLKDLPVFSSSMFCFILSISIISVPQ